MDFGIKFEREEDGRWIAEISQLSGVIAYGATKDESEIKVRALAREVVHQVGVRLANLGGSAPGLQIPPRRRPVFPVHNER